MRMSPVASYEHLAHPDFTLVLNSPAALNRALQEKCECLRSVNLCKVCLLTSDPWA